MTSDDLPAITQWEAAVSKPLLHPEQERMLLRRVGSDDPGVSERARVELVERNMRLVISCTGPWLSMCPSADRDTLIQEGAMGLYHAIGKFDPSFGTKLSTYAYPWINQRMQRSITDQGLHYGGIKVPGEILRMMAKAAKQIERGNLAKDDETVARYCGIPVDRLLAARRAQQTWSLNATAANAPEDTEFGQIIPATEPEFTDPSVMLSERDEASSAGKAILDRLPERERQIIQLRFGLGAHANDAHTWLEVAERLGISEQTVRRLEKRAFNRLRGKAGALTATDDDAEPATALRTTYVTTNLDRVLERIA